MTARRLIIAPALTLLAFAAIINTAHAQEPGTPPPSPLRERLQELRGERRDLRGDILDARENFLDDRKDLRDRTRDALKNATSGPEKRDILKDARDARKDLLDDRASTTAAMKDRFRELVQTHLGVAKDRFGMAIRQFENLVGRIESRIEKLRSDGVDTAAAETELDEAKRAIEEAKADAKTVADLVGSAKESDDRTAFRNAVKAAMRDAAESVKAAHQALKDAVRALVSLPKPAAQQNSN